MQFYAPTANQRRHPRWTSRDSRFSLVLGRLAVTDVELGFLQDLCDALWQSSTSGRCRVFLVSFLRRRRTFAVAVWRFAARTADGHRRTTQADEYNADETRVEDKWRTDKSGGRLFHKSETVWWEDPSVILRRECIEGRLCMTRKDKRRMISCKTKKKTRIWRMTRMKCFICHILNFTMNCLIYFEPMNKFKNRRGENCDCWWQHAGAALKTSHRRLVWGIWRFIRREL